MKKKKKNCDLKERLIRKERIYVWELKIILGKENSAVEGCTVVVVGIYFMIYIVFFFGWLLVVGAFVECDGDV